MSFFNPYIPIKSVERSHHPWEKRIKAKYSNAYKHGHNSVNNPICPASKTDKKSESQEESNKNEHIKFTVIGNRVTKEFIYCMYLVKGLHKCRQKQFEAPVIRGLTGIEWPKVWNDLKLKFGSPAYCLRSQVAVLKNDELLGGESELKEFVETRYVYNLYLDYYIEGVKQFANFVKSSGRPCVYMHISIDSQPVGSLIFMLYADIAPLTCQNFMKMCQLSRGGYAGSPIHRIVQDCWIQCGGFLLKSPDILTCENYIVPHDKRGVLGMVNNGRHEDCSTQFFVLLQPAPWMNDRFVAFGQLIDGDKTLEKIESVTTWYESPTSDIIIDRAGILNLECQRMPINKRTNEYIEGHIEDLVLIGHLFYEALLDKVFIEIEIKNLQRFENQLRENAEEVITIKSFRKTERYVGTKEEKQDNLLTPVTGQSTENNDFDVDEYEYEDVYDDKPFTPVASSVVTPSKFYYLPLTDVPYPDEVDSIYDLKRFLRGDYCLESDLKKDLNKPEDEPFNLNVPKHVIETLFDYLTINVDLSDSSLSEEDETIVKTYLRENKDSTSFAGRIVTKMANLSQKLSLFDDTLDEKTNKNIILADEDLRLIRVAQKEMASIRKRNVSMSSDTHFPHGVIRRRPTGFVRPEDLVRFVQEVDEDDDDNNDNEILVPRTDSSRFFITGLSQMKKQSEDTGAIYSKGYLKKHDDLKKVTIASSPNLLPISNHVGKLRSNLGLTEETNEVRRTSVLQRLFMELDANSDDDEAPTLKNYKPMAESNKKHFLLTNSHYEIHYDDERLKHVNQVVDGDNSIDRILQLQHGKRFSRKISSDYVKTIDQLENMEKPSIRSVEYSKRRPSMTIAKYQEKNREYYENLVTTQDKMTTTETRSQRGKTRKTKK